MTGKEFNNLPEIKEPKWCGLTKIQWLIVSLSLIGILLNMITVVAVYYGCGRNMKPQVVKSIAPPSTQQRQLEIDSELDQINGRSADEEVTTTICPPPKITTCLPQESCKDLPVCKSDKALDPCNCVVPPDRVLCPTSSNIAPLSILAMEGRRPFDLLRGLAANSPFDPDKTVYKVRSYERLQAAMNLMENYYEPYYEMFTRRKCDGEDLPSYFSPGDERRICPLCRNRYNYWKCIYENILTSPGDRNQQTLARIPVGTNERFNGKSFLSSVRGIWGGSDPQYMQLADYTTSNFIANRNAMTLIANIPGTNATTKCIPCDTDILRHGNCLVDKSINMPNWIWNPNIQHAEA